MISTFSHSTSVVALTYEVLKGIEGHVVVPVYEVVELTHRNLQVRDRELMVLVPAQWSIVASLQQNGMEHGEAERNLLEIG